MSVLVYILIRWRLFQWNQVQNIRNRNPFIVKVFILHRILQTIFFQTFHSILFFRLVPSANIVQLRCRQRYFNKQSLDQRRFQFKQFLVFLIIIRYFLFRNIIRQFLVYQFLLIGMHNQSFPVILHQLIYIHIIRNIIRSFFIQQNLLRPATNVMLGEKNAIIFWQSDR